MSNEIPRLSTILPETATGRVKELFDTAQNRNGVLPTLFHHMANAPVALEGFMEMQRTLEEGVLPVELREKIALAVGEYNQSLYCVAVHAFIGQHIGLDAAAIETARQAHSTDHKTQSALNFVSAILRQHGAITDEQMEQVRAAGFTDGEIVEIVANISWNIFANYMDSVVRPAEDFPPVTQLSSLA